MTTLPDRAWKMSFHYKLVMFRVTSAVTGPPSNLPPEEFNSINLKHGIAIPLHIQDQFISAERKHQFQNLQHQTKIATYLSIYLSLSIYIYLIIMKTIILGKLQYFTNLN